MEEQRNWIAPGKPLPALILLIGIIAAQINIPYAFSRSEFQYLNNVEIITYPNLVIGLLISIPSIMLAVFGFLLFYGRIDLNSRDLVLKYSPLLVILAILGIISPFIFYMGTFLSPSLSFGRFPLLLDSPFGIFSISLVINGLVGLCISKRELKAKFSRFFNYLFGFIAVLGTVFVTFAVIFLYWSITGSEMLDLLPFTPLLGAFFFFCLLGGPVFITIGVLVIGRKYLKNHQNLFTLLALLAIIAIPLCIFALVCCSLSRPMPIAI